MSATVRTVTCRYCGGNGKAEKLERLDEHGDWVRDKLTDHAKADAQIQAGNTRLRWVTTKCPICGGSGEYELEFTPCRIF